MSEVSLTAGGYRYRGGRTDMTGDRPVTLSRRILGTLEDLGGQASTTDIRAALERSGYKAGSRQVPDALHRLAKLTPPAVTPVGDPRGGFGKAQDWRLEHAETGECGGCGHLTGTPIHRIVCGDGEL